MNQALSPQTELLSLDQVSMVFKTGHVLRPSSLQALTHINLTIHRGRALALVGESGSGKSTCAKILSQVYQPTAGRVIRANGQEPQAKPYRHFVQMIFQDPFSSLNPTLSVGYHIERPLALRGMTNKQLRQAECLALLRRVGLQPAEDVMAKKPHELSGGQRQRVAIARAIALQPDVILADEPTSMLDVSVRLGILELLTELKTQHNIGFLYITHDIATAQFFAEDIAVLYAGHIVERAPAKSLVKNHQHPYTQLLLESAPNPRQPTQWQNTDSLADVPQWTPESKGCPFASRCPKATQVCTNTMPQPKELHLHHWVSCHHS